MGNSIKYGIKDKKFYDIIMPGTHDSLAKEFLNFKIGPASDEMNKLKLAGDYLYCCGCFLC